MNGMSPLAGATLGALISVGLVLIVAGWRGHRISLPTSERAARVRQIDLKLLAAAVAAGLMVTVVTRWPVAGIGVALTVWASPKLFGGQNAGARELERLEALALWCESLRDTIAGNLGLEQAIPATVEAAPARLQEPLSNLVAMLRSRVPLPEALGVFADELDDSGADLIVAALILNARLHGPGLRETLTELAANARDELEQRQVVEAGRASVHRSGRILVGVVAAFLAGLALFAGDFMAPYSTPTGQLVMVGIGGVFAAAFARLRSLSEYQRPARFLRTEATTAGPVILR